MDISLLLTSLAGSGRPAEGPGATSQGSAAAGAPVRGFADALAALQGAPAPGGSSTALPGLPASAADQASLATMMQALSQGTGESLLAEGEMSEGPLAEIAQRLALIASVGEPSPEDAGRLALLAKDPGGETLDGDLAVTAPTFEDLLPDAPGQMAAVATEFARAPLGVHSEAGGTAALLSPSGQDTATTAQQQAALALASASRGEPAASTQRLNPAADALPAALIRAGDAAQAPAAPFVEPRGEWRTEGMAGLSGSAPGSGASAASASQGSLAAPLNSPAWSGQLGQQLVMMGQRGGEQRVELHLNPAELGPLTISLKVSEQGAQAQFLSAHAPVRQAVEQAIPQLREALAEQGISLGETSVGEHRQQGQGERQALARGPGTGGASSGSEEIDLNAGASAAVPLAEGRVDLYA